MIRHPRLCCTVLTLIALSASACGPLIIVQPAATAASPAATTAKAAVARVKPTGEPPHVGDAKAIEAFKQEGKVQVRFKGLGNPNAPVRPGARQRKLQATTADIASVRLDMRSASGQIQTQVVSREQLLAPFVSLFFDRVVAGEGALLVTALDANGIEIGSGDQSFKVSSGQTTEVSMSIRLSATGSVSAQIGFEDPEIQDENLTGYWVINRGPEPPAGPLVGCNRDNVWYVTQADQFVYADVSGYNDANATAHAGQFWHESATGRFEGNQLKLRGEVTYTNEYGEPIGPVEVVDYALSYDKASHHLSGTRNGEAGWGAPFFYDPGCDGPTPAPSYGPIFYPSPQPSGYAPTPGPNEVVSYDASVRGRVTDAQGQPLTGGTIYLYTQDVAGGLSREVAIGSDGTFSLSGLPSYASLEFSVYGADPDDYGYQYLYTFSGENSLDIQVEHYESDPDVTAWPATPGPSGSPWASYTPGPAGTPWPSFTPYPSSTPWAYTTAAPSSTPWANYTPAPSPSATPGAGVVSSN